MDSTSLESVATFDVFISHTREDQQLAEQVETVLEASGYKCFRATDDLNGIVGTKQWSEAIEALLVATPVLIVLVTNAGLASRWVTFEWRAFHEDVLAGRRSGLVVPILCEPLADKLLPSALRYWQIVGLPVLGRERGFAALVTLIDGFRRATRNSGAELDRRLHWTRASNTPSPVSGASVAVGPPARTSVAGPSRRTWALLGAGAFAVAVLSMGLAWSALKRVAPQSGMNSDFLGPKLLVPDSSGTAISASAVPPPSVDPRPQPRAGWEPIEAYERPTLGNRNLVGRRDTWDEARAAFERSCQPACSKRNRAALHFVMAEWLRLSNQLDKASEELELARVTDESWILPLIAQAVIEVERKPDLAIERARQALRLDPRQWLAMHAKAAALVRQQKYAESIVELHRAHDMAPADCQPIVDGALVLVYHSYGGLNDAQAKTLALSSCTAERKVSSACAVLAELALEAGNADSALRYVDIAARDDSVPLLMARGDAYQLKNEMKLAWAAWDSAVGLKDRAEAQGAAMKRFKEIERAVSSRQAPPPHGKARSVPAATGRSTIPPRPIRGGVPAAPMDIELK
ncbi:MAG TPA: TIR domain-containing protein [Polyangiaceae bacterium]|nr:TIR domain-containing protein [Polyangiaceae bacterium]